MSNGSWTKVDWTKVIIFLLGVGLSTLINVIRVEGKVENMKTDLMGQITVLRTEVVALKETKNADHVRYDTDLKEIKKKIDDDESDIQTLIDVFDGKIHKLPRRK